MKICKLSKLNKCEFLLNEVKFLGHVISQEGVTIDSSKIKAVMDWLRPTMVHEVGSFLSLPGYYRRFVKGNSKLSSSLTMLTRKNTKFIWIDKCSTTFGYYNRLMKGYSKLSSSLTVLTRKNTKFI